MKSILGDCDCVQTDEGGVGQGNNRVYNSTVPLHKINVILMTKEG